MEAESSFPRLRWPYRIAFFTGPYRGPPQGVNIRFSSKSVDAAFIAEQMPDAMSGCLAAFVDDRPGVPLVEHFREIAAKLKELEAKRQHEAKQET